MVERYRTLDDSELVQIVNEYADGPFWFHAALDELLTRVTQTDAR